MDKPQSQTNAHLFRAQALSPISPLPYIRRLLSFIAHISKPDRALIIRNYHAWDSVLTTRQEINMKNYYFFSD